MQEIICTGCSRKLRVQPEWAGKNIKCPQCNTVQRIDSVEQESAWPNSIGSSSNAVSGNAFSEPHAGAAKYPELPRELNPYASPSMPGPQINKPANVNWRHQAIGVGDILERTWNLFAENLSSCLVMGVILLGVHIGKGVVTSGVTNAAQAMGDVWIFLAANLIAQIFDFLVTIYLNLGANIYALKIARRENASPADLFAGGAFFVRGLGLNFLMALCIYGLILLGMIPAGVVFLSQGQEAFQRDPTMVMVALGVGITPMIILCGWLAMRWFVALTMLVDRDGGVFDSLANSATYMNGSKLMTFLAMLLVGILGPIAVVLTCCVGMIAYVPFLAIMPVVVYFGITGQAIAGLKQPLTGPLPERIDLPGSITNVSAPQPQFPPSSPGSEGDPFGPPKQ